MSDRAVRSFLTALREVARLQKLYPAGHPLIREAVMAAIRAAAHIGSDAGAADGEVVLTLLDDAFYLGPRLLAQTSLEMNGLLRAMQDRGIDSVTLINPLAPADLAELAAFVAGLSDDVPASGTVRLNERPLSLGSLQRSTMAGLRSSYVSSLDVLRSVGLAVKGGSDFELGGAVTAVESLLERSVAQPGASLLLATVKSHDEYTFYHSVNTCILSLAIGRLIGLDETALVRLGLGALLHDIGKLGVSTSVLQHPGRLAPEQWAEIKLHPQEGAAAILASAAPGQEVAATIALEHHARFDGSGYPKLPYLPDDHGHEHESHATPLHFFSRLVSVADTYDAITTRRSYRRAETPNRALHVLLNGAGTSYDPDFVRAFIYLMGEYPTGSLLRLADGAIVVVAHQDREGSGRAVGLMVEDATGRRPDEPEPFEFSTTDVVDQLLPARVGVDPAALLEHEAARGLLAADAAAVEAEVVT